MKLILKTQQRFRSESEMFLLKKVTSSNDDKRMQSIDWIETYAYGTSKDLVYEKEKVKYNNK